MTQFTYGQINISTPTLGFTQACASSGFNSYNLNFTFGPVTNLQTGNQFIVELSDGNGGFTSPTLLATSTNTSSPVAINFSFPTTVSGENYKIRIRSTAPVSMSPSSASFAAHYAIFNQPFTINNSISTTTVCGTSNYTLSVDSGVNSPINNNNLNYKWFKNNVEIIGETESSLIVTEAGTYYVKVDYGSCNYNAFSNAVNINFTSGVSISLTSAGNNTNICPSTGLLLSSSLTSSAFTYKWYKNDVLVSSNNSSTFTATSSGIYKVMVNNGVCDITSNSLNLTEQNITASLNSGSTLTIVPGLNTTISCTSDAVNPSFQWFKNNVLQSGQTTNQLTINSAGTYKVKVTQNTGCTLSKEAETFVNHPSTYSLVLKNSSVYQACSSTSETLSIESFSTIINGSSIDLLTLGIPLTYRWYRNNSLINGANGNSLTVSNFLNNGIYELRITLSDGTIVISNTKEVKLKFGSTTTITSNGFICIDNPSVTLNSSLTNSNFTYRWYKSGNSAVLSSSPTCVVTETGFYYVEISYMGCSYTSTLFQVTAIDETSISINYDEIIELNEGGQANIEVTGGDSYEWIVNNEIVSTASSFIVSQEGFVNLKVTKSGCTIEKIFEIVINNQVFNSVIPNVITPNNDGVNDFWILPEDIAYKDDVEVTIYSSDNTILFKGFNYQNNWPFEPVKGRNNVFYYTIKSGSKRNQGTITVVK